MKDAFGHELAIGDRVGFTTATERYIEKGYVKRLTEKSVIVAYQYNPSRIQREVTYPAKPASVIKLEFQEKPPAIIQAIKRAQKIKEERGYEYKYWFVDLHRCIITPTYNSKNKNAEFYPDAIKVLRHLTESESDVIILWTSSYLGNLDGIYEKLASQGVRFNATNANPFEESTELCDFSKKPYFDILIDDKAGFDGESDWTEVAKYLGV